jgi:predicted ester cyclase
MREPTIERTSFIFNTLVVLVLIAGVALSAHTRLKRASPQQISIAAGRPETLIVAGDIPADRRDAMLASAERFYRFWNTGDEMLLRQAISETFVDHTLPPGRPQGPAGPAAASKAFLAAVPDLKVVVAQQILAGDRVVSHLHFTGHFTGVFNGSHGTGQPIEFIATDILAVRAGKITDNWHLEDNLTFLRQIGLAMH